MRKLVAMFSLAALALAACSSGGSSDTPKADGKPQVLASFYPLQYLTEQIGKDHIDVSSLTPKGAEPHDLELAPAQVSTIGKADAVIYLSGFQPSVDKAITEVKPDYAYDAAKDANLVAADHDHGDHDHGDDHDHAHGNLDPHFWLDPARMADVAPKIAATLSAIDPDNAADYEANAKTVAESLRELKDSISQGLKTCEKDTIVVAHEAYGYLVSDAHIQQVGLSGIDPESEPSPATLAAIKKLMAEKHVTTVFTESLINPKAAETFAKETGAKTAVLDPLENQADDSKDYVAVMKENLEALRSALECN
ncbi:zinc transport system substrate-binding protein [Bowdeniella nasicola]|uniref:Zinc transport system substrate-binding protein n=1 Tax=Bowdeniella nasicola TaxID=208480 RepID=A0A1H3W6X8_9ACTO|nr:metal ABC transporter substrate-binding protein [Bowdeniella nasicola]SDZ82038.1 zinc transport system substrate-binding protein [Bowdeniella nasicola]